MATSAKNLPLHVMLGQIGSIPAVAADIIYEGSMVGDNGAGYGRPLVDGDKFVGHAVANVNNLQGAAGDRDIVTRIGRYRAVVPLVGVRTDVNCPVYASDDATYSFIGVYSYVGVITRYVDATHMEVEFRPGEMDEWGTRERIAKIDNYTMTINESGAVVYLSVTAKTITLLAVADGHEFIVVNPSPFGTVLIHVDPNGSDALIGGGQVVANAVGHKMSNTANTQQRNDYFWVKSAGANAWTTMGIRGTWAAE